MKRHQPRYKYILSVETANVLNITGELDFGNTLIFSNKHRAAFKLKEWNIDLKKTTMKRTLEDKARFFAQYHNQMVLRWNKVESHPVDNYRAISKAYLELTPLSSITDEHAIMIYNFLEGKSVDIEEAQAYCCGYFCDNDCSHTIASDFLRSKGYAMFYNGISVEEQIELGWIKLKTK